ncbi:MAG: hypothetical protein JWN10_931 [Solirubrobacterales bacterium]|nr:hypothetical protein [Solirubrobacterales bacterium]
MSGNPSPFDFEQARAAARAASEAQASTETAIREAVQTRAGAERAYRRALARRIVSAHDEGIAWSVCSDIARGDDAVSELRYERDVAEGVCEALSQAGWRHSADRKDLTRLIAWSERVAPDGQSEPSVRRAG